MVPPSRPGWVTKPQQESPDRVRPIGTRAELLHEGYDMTDIKWQTPPAHGNSGSQIDRASVADTLRANPDQWALIRESASHAGDASAIKNGRLAAFRPSGSFEARSVKVNGGFDIYARFVGEVQR